MKKLVNSQTQPQTLKQHANYRLGRFFRQLLGVPTATRHESLAKATYSLSPHTLSTIKEGIHGSTHYGVMIPDLPEPYRYLSCASVIGFVGFPITDIDFATNDLGKGDSASFVHGTAISSTKEAFRALSLTKDIQIETSPLFSIKYGKDTHLYEKDGLYYLKTKRDDLEVDLCLTPTAALSWFAHSYLYQHFTLLVQYSGTITQHGQSIQVQGLGTLENWRAVATSVLKNRWITNHVQLPLDYFTYNVIALDDQRQLVLCYLTYAEQPVFNAVYYRHIDGTSILYDGDSIYKITNYQSEPAIAPDGSSMPVPDTFEWTAYHQGKIAFRMIAKVDTPYCFGLAAGFVSSYQWEGEFEGKSMDGRGYLEYINKQPDQ